MRDAEQGRIHSRGGGLVVQHLAPNGTAPVQEAQPVSQARGVALRGALTHKSCALPARPARSGPRVCNAAFGNLRCLNPDHWPLGAPPGSPISSPPFLSRNSVRTRTLF